MQVRTRWPYFNASVAAAKLAAAEGRAYAPNHLWLFPHDEGACWAPHELYTHSVILTHWGRMDARPKSSSRYIPDNWEHAWDTDQRAPAGQVTLHGRSASYAPYSTWHLLPLLSASRVSLTMRRGAPAIVHTPPANRCGAFPKAGIHTVSEARDR